MAILPIQVGTRLFSFSFPFLYTLQTIPADLFSGRSPLVGSSRSGATPRMPSADTARERTNLGPVQESQRASQEMRLETETPGLTAQPWAQLEHTQAWSRDLGIQVRLLRAKKAH